MKINSYKFLSLFAIFFFIDNDTLALLRYKHNKVVTCYVASWAIYRNHNGMFEISDINPELCTHIIYAFAGLNNESWTIKSLDPHLDIERDNYKNMIQLHKKNPNLKILLAIGGWNEGSQSYSVLASSPDRRSKFIDSVVKFLGEYRFNGFDLDWEYPGSRRGMPADKQNFVFLLKELKEAFKKSNYLLTAALSSNKAIIDMAYDIPEISKYLDYIHIMAYDYHGTWNRKVLPNAPLKSEDGQSVVDTLTYLLNKGAPSNKMVLGLPMYGRTFILANKLNSSKESPIGQTSISDGFKGPYTGENGFMGYNEICEELITNVQKWTTGWDDNSNTPYIINDDHVIMFDNPKSLKAKVEYAMSLNLSGVMIWSIDTDDFNGKCASLNNSLDLREKKYPLLRSINMVLSQIDYHNYLYDNNDDNNDKNNKNNNNTSSVMRFSNNLILIILFFLYFI
ncbi:probable chitinase 2 [Apis mellifera]|uniref:Probable chitinase 2 n=1 Tax=Apis mellifera TaxID=7460 RepID=A0A7M7MTN1_APIME|nr:probable chitinase 2 [Apis mellifera]|eukprot:XP_026300868.1 probable chitinase 2 [Apis mellifera]